MSIPVVAITAEGVRKLQALQEGHFFDMKAIDIAPGKLTRTISAFANADGGELYIGFDEDKFAGLNEDKHPSWIWRGFAKPEEANGHIQIFDELFPLGRHFSIEFLKCQTKTGLVMHVDVKKTRDIKVASDGIAYVRRGAQSLPQNSAEKLARLRLNKGLDSFESETVNYDLGKLERSSVLHTFIQTVVPAAEPHEWLDKQELIKEGKPTVAGILLYAEAPQAALPKRCGIKIYRYKTRDVEGSRETLDFNPITIEGCAYDQVKDAVARTIAIIENIQTLGTTGFEKVRYPTETIHEIVTNAVLHRDYSIADDVHIRIFDNRVEVVSPGVLPADVTEDNFMQTRWSRNGNLVRLINKFPDPPNKDVGEGLKTAFSAMRKLKLKDPVLQQRASSVIVYIKHEPLAGPEEIVMTYLETHAEINNSKGRAICHIASDTIMKTVFNRLMRAGLIEPIPGRRTSTSAYRTKPKT